MHIFHPQFTVRKVTERIYQTCFSQPDGFNFSACKHDAGRIGINQCVIERGTLIFYIYRSLFHCSPSQN